MTVSTEPTIQDITKCLQRQLQTIEGLRAYAVEPDQPNLPCAYPRLVDWTYNDTFASYTTTWHFDLWILVNVGSQFGRAQNEINDYLSPTGYRSIKQAVDCDPELNARAVGGGTYGRVDIGGVAALGASIRIEVLT